jgi:hypothetical protein
MCTGFTSATNQDDFKGWVVEFHHELSDELTQLPMALADHHQYIIMRQMRKSLDGRASMEETPQTNSDRG